jgi:hypothetical protein
LQFGLTQYPIGDESPNSSSFSLGYKYGIGEQFPTYPPVF